MEADADSTQYNIKYNILKHECMLINFVQVFTIQKKKKWAWKVQNCNYLTVDSGLSQVELFYFPQQ